MTRLVFAALCLLACSQLIFASPEDQLRKLVGQYQTVKKRLSPGQGSFEAAVKEKLAPLLEDIAAVDSDAAIRFLQREYADRNPAIAAACGLALLGSDRPEATAIVIRGYNRGGRWPLTARIHVLDELAALGDEDAVDFVRKLATKGDADSRTLALGSLDKLPGKDQALETVLENLQHPSYQVRNAALRALGSFRKKAMISPLIERLGEEKDEKLRFDLLKLLVELTGFNMGYVVEDWKKWWDVAEPRFDFEKDKGAVTSVLPADLTYFGIEVASKRVSFLVDASNSMQGRTGGGGRGKRGKAQILPGDRKIDVLKKELTRIIRELPDDARVNIVSFAKTFRPWKSELQPLAGGGRREAIFFVQGLSLAWGTNIYDTLEFALEDRRVDTIFLLSDGRPVGGKYSKPEDIIREIGAINRLRGATIHCISFGKETEFLKKLARQNGGTYRATSPTPQKAKPKGKQGKRKR